MPKGASRVDHSDAVNARTRKLAEEAERKRERNFARQFKRNAVAEVEQERGNPEYMSGSKNPFLKAAKKRKR